MDKNIKIPHRCGSYFMSVCIYKFYDIVYLVVIYEIQQDLVALSSHPPTHPPTTHKSYVVFPTVAIRVRRSELFFVSNDLSLNSNIIHPHNNDILDSNCTAER